MREVLSDLLERTRRGEATGLGRVIRTYNSAPRPAGAAMLRGAEGDAVGSISGGCVEGAVYELSGEVLDTGAPVKIRYGVSDDDAFAVGLTCGGTLDVFVEPISAETFPEIEEFAAAIAAEEPVALVTVVAHPDPERLGKHLLVRPDRFSGTTGSDVADERISADVRGALDLGATMVLTYGPDGERQGSGMEIFVDSFVSRPRMIVFGAIDFAAAVARQGSLMGYHVTVCDARPLFTTERRFPQVDELVVNWPHRYLNAEIDAGRVDARTVVCVLTHDPKFDVPAIQAALRLPQSAYIGVMGSRRTHEDRTKRLREAGVTDAELARLHSPIGLGIGARTPAETAVSIAAEIISLRWGGVGQRLAELTGPIHAEPIAEVAV